MCVCGTPLAQRLANGNKTFAGRLRLFLKSLAEWIVTRSSELSLIVAVASVGVGGSACWRDIDGGAMKNPPTTAAVEMELNCNMIASAKKEPSALDGSSLC